jgi:hypothetical protein
MRIGIDFDNTIISYDAVFAAAAAARGLLPAGFAGGKQAVRDAIRRRPDGEQDWQRLQGHVYGAGIAGAQPFDGVEDFLRRARAAGARVLIVSHKTEYGHFDPHRVNLRTAALAWMEARGLFAGDGAAIDRADVHFAATRAEKLARIGALGCTLFIDDLEEVLDDPDFPAGVARILFADRAEPEGAPYRVCRSWPCIGQAVFR